MKSNAIRKTGPNHKKASLSLVHSQPKWAQKKAKAKSKKIRVLCLDGGGIRGIIPATILCHFEKRLQEKTGDSEVRLSDYFDLLAGTSTGGILVCSYLVANPDQKDRPKLTAEQALNLYLKKGKQIFKKPFFRRIRTLMGFAEEKYSAKGLESALKKTLGEETKLSSFLKPCLIPAYDITNRNAVFFNSEDARHNASNDYKAWQIARATSAAPTYFEPAMVQTEMGLDLPLVDGGVFANNPGMCAYAEAHKTRFSEVSGSKAKVDHPTSKDMIMVSVGTGSVMKAYEFKKMKDKGSLGWIKPIIDIMMSGNAETVNHQLKQLFIKKNKEKKCGFYRLEPELHKADSEMDNVKNKNLKALHQAGIRFVTENRELIDDIIDELIENH